MGGGGCGFSQGKTEANQGLLRNLAKQLLRRRNIYFHGKQFPNHDLFVFRSPATCSAPETNSRFQARRK